MKKKVIGITIITFGYLIFSVIASIITKDSLHLFFGWNMILSTVVIYLGMLMMSTKVQQLKKGWFILLSLLWLFFFPNAFYFITDFIHLSRYDFFMETGYLSYLFVQNFSGYVALSHILVGVFISLSYGTLSLSLMKKAFEMKFEVKTKEYFVFSILFLSSIGIGIGRFLRFNTWDIFRPFQMVSTILSEFNWFFVEFILLFFLLQLFVYYSFQLIRNYK